MKSIEGSSRLDRWLGGRGALCITFPPLISMKFFCLLCVFSMVIWKCFMAIISYFIGLYEAWRYAFNLGVGTMVHVWQTRVNAFILLIEISHAFLNKQTPGPQYSVSILALGSIIRTYQKLSMWFYRFICREWKTWCYESRF